MHRFDILHLEYFMNSSGIGPPSGNLQVGPTHIEGGTPAPANTPLSLHASSLTSAYLSQHSFQFLNAMGSQGVGSDKQLASLVKNSMQSDSLQLSPNHQQTGITGIVQYGRQENKNALVVQAKLNEKSEYDILAVAFRGAFEKPVLMRFPEPRGDAAGTAPSQHPLLSLPNEFLQQIDEPLQFTPPPPTASTQPSTVNPAADFARLHSPHPGPFRLSGDDKPESAERNQRLRSALLCGWDNLRRVDPDLVSGLLNYYQANVSLSQGEFGILEATFEKNTQGLYLTRLGYGGTETNWENETGVVLPEQASPPPRGELTSYTQQPRSLSPLLTEEPTGSKGKKRAAPSPPEPPSTRPGFQPTQLGGTQIQGIPLERKQSLEQLVNNTILHAQKSKVGKNSPAVNQRFKEGVAAINAQPGKTPIDQQAAAAFYANASAGVTPFPKVLSEKFSASKDKLAKTKLGPDATAADYARANKDKLAKARFGPDATAIDYDRANSTKRAKAMFGPDATAADYSRANKDKLAKAMFGPDATAADYARANSEKRAKAMFGPDATAADYARATKDKLAKARFGPDATANDYDRAKKDELAKAKLGPAATANDYDRETRKKLAKDRLGPDATANDYDRETRKKLAKARFGPDATPADYSRANKDKLAKARLGPDASVTDYNRAMIAAQAVRELGPTATAADLATLQAQELALAAQLGVRVEEIRSARKQGPASGEPSFPGPNQR
ncbi:hypothetical protein ABH912_005486 [Pseudomonas sp. BT76 TE3572]